MSDHPVNLTNDFLRQKRAVSDFTSIDIAYITGEVEALVQELVEHKKSNRLKQSYDIYLYGKSFIEYSDRILIIINGLLGQKKISSFKLKSSTIGSIAELTTYPNLAGLKVTVCTIN